MVVFSACLFLSELSLQQNNSYFGEVVQVCFLPISAEWLNQLRLDAKLYFIGISLAMKVVYK